MPGPQPVQPIRLPRLELRTAAKVAVIFVVCLAGWYAVRRPYLSVAARNTEPVIRVMLDSPGPVDAHIDGNRFVVNTGLAFPNVAGATITVRVVGVLQTGWNTPILVALILITPWPRLRRSVPWVLGAAAIVWVSQVLTLSLVVVDATADSRAQLGEQVANTRALDFSQGYALVTRFWLPIAAMLPVWLRRLKGPAQATAANVGRNAPCPCGSGKKFKQCCGATHARAGASTRPTTRRGDHAP